MPGVDSSSQQPPDVKSILVLGAAGMLGHMLVRTLSDSHRVIGTTSHAFGHPGKLAEILPRDRCVDLLDVRDSVKVERTIRDWQPDVVVNCVGLIKHKMDDDRVLDAVLINSAFPHQLARLCDELKTRLIHFSTDCVFAGTPGVKRLTDRPDATDVYGTTKRLGEVGYGTSLTLRTSFVGRQIVGAEELVEWVISQRSGQITAYRKAIYSGLTTRALSDVVRQIIDRHPNLVGLYQVASSPITKFDLISHLNDKLRLDITINPDTKFECDRTLDGSYFGRVTGIQVPSWEEMLSEFCSDQAFYS
jgi:dTDP-4-dehydrorhamnose reductase